MASSPLEEALSAAATGPTVKRRDTGPDLLFALVFGIYAAVSTTGVVLVAITAGLTADPGLVYLAGLAWLSVATVTGTVLLRRVRGLSRRFGVSPAAWSLPLAPLLLQALVVATVAVGLREVGGRAWLPVALAGAGGLVLGLILVVMARTRTVKARVAGERVRTEWRAGWPRPERTWIVRLASASVAIGAVAMAAGIWFRVEALIFSGQFVIPVAAAAAARTEPVRYRATSIGIEEIGPVYRRLHAWEDLSGYTLDEERIVVGRRRPWRPALRWNRHEVANVSALREALATNLQG